MSPSHIVMQDDFPWYGYAFFTGFLAIGAWIGYRAGKGVWALVKLGSFRKQVREIGGPVRAMAISIWFTAMSRIALFLLVAVGTWIIIRANFCSFQQLDVSSSSMRLSYELRFLHHELPLPSISSIEIVRYKHRKFGLQIVMVDGAVYRSTDSDDEAVMADSRRLVESFRNQRPNATLPATALKATTMNCTMDICGVKQIHNPTEEDIRQAVFALDTNKGDAFLVIGLADMTYIQTTGDQKVGFVLEYQETDVKHHYQAKRDLTADEVVRALTSYSTGSDDWKRIAEWGHIKL